MTYVRCDECGFTAARGPISLVGSCPRCRLRGRKVSLIELSGAPSDARSPDLLWVSRYLDAEERTAPG
jgi:hypothetical protein